MLFLLCRNFHCYLKATQSREPESQTPLLGVTSGFSLKACDQDIRKLAHQNYNSSRLVIYLITDMTNSISVGFTYGLDDGTSSFSCISVSYVPESCFPEVFENVDFFGADYRTLFTPNYEECQRACTQDPACQFFTFLNENFPGTSVR